MSKNNIDKRLEARGYGKLEDQSEKLQGAIKRLAKKDMDVIAFDAVNDILDTLRPIYEKENPGIPFDEWIYSKDDDFFKRLEYAGGGKVIQFPIDMTKYRKEAEPKEINISGSFSRDRTIDSLSKAERELVNKLLRLSLGKDK